MLSHTRCVLRVCKGTVIRQWMVSFNSWYLPNLPKVIRCDCEKLNNWPEKRCDLPFQMSVTRYSKRNNCTNSIWIQFTEEKATDCSLKILLTLYKCVSFYYWELHFQKSSLIVIWKQGLWHEQICLCHVGQQWNLSTQTFIPKCSVLLRQLNPCHQDLFQLHLSTQHRHHLRLGMASRFMSPSSALITVFSPYYLFCGAAQLVLLIQSDGLCYLFSATI